MSELRGDEEFASLVGELASERGRADFAEREAQGAWAECDRLRDRLARAEEALREIARCHDIDVNGEYIRRDVAVYGIDALNVVRSYFDVLEHDKSQ